MTDAKASGYRKLVSLFKLLILSGGQRRDRTSATTAFASTAHVFCCRIAAISEPIKSGGTYD